MSIATPFPIEPASAPSRPSNATEVTRDVLAPLLEHPQPNDVRFYFPRTSSELWANSTLLKNASPYFRDLLNSEFGEGLKEGVDGQAKQRTTITAEEEADPDDGGDSDDEWDSRHPPPKVPDKETTPIKFHEVVVRESAYGTYRAVLLWMYSGSITFRRLASFGSNPTQTLSRQYSASPKSIFKLADLLRIPALKKLALTALVSMISVDNAATELYDELSTLYPEVQNQILEFVKKNWSSVKDSAGMKEIERRMERDEVPMGGATTLRLAKQLPMYEYVKAGVPAGVKPVGHLPTFRFSEPSVPSGW